MVQEWPSVRTWNKLGTKAPLYQLALLYKWFYKCGLYTRRATKKPLLTFNPSLPLSIGVCPTKKLSTTLSLGKTNHGVLHFLLSYRTTDLKPARLQVLSYSATIKLLRSSCIQCIFHACSPYFDKKIFLRGLWKYWDKFAYHYHLQYNMSFLNKIS